MRILTAVQQEKIGTNRVEMDNPADHRKLFNNLNANLQKPIRDITEGERQGRVVRRRHFNAVNITC